jgi:hypothetical protein
MENSTTEALVRPPQGAGRCTTYYSSGPADAGGDDRRSSFFSPQPEDIPLNGRAFPVGGVRLYTLQTQTLPPVGQEKSLDGNP